MRGRPVILTGAGPAADAKRRALERVGGVIVPEAATAVLAIVADDEDDVALATVTRLKARGVLVNAVDRPALCDFTLPAIIDRDPLVVSIATGGASAGLAKAVRQRLEAILPANLGMLAARLAAARDAIRARWPDGDDRRRAIDAALSEDGPLDALSGRADVDGWLAMSAEISAPVLVSIALNSPDPDDLTLRTARLLGQADRVYHSADVPSAILNRARADAQRIAGPAPDFAEPGVTIVLTIA